MCCQSSVSVYTCYVCKYPRLYLSCSFHSVPHRSPGSKGLSRTLECGLCSQRPHASAMLCTVYRQSQYVNTYLSFRMRSLVNLFVKYLIFFFLPFLSAERFNAGYQPMCIMQNASIVQLQDVGNVPRFGRREKKNN